MTRHDIVRRYAAPMIVTCALAGVPVLAVANSAERSEGSYPQTAREAQNPVSAPARTETSSESSRGTTQGTSSGELSPHSRREAQNPISAPEGDAEEGTASATQNNWTRELHPQTHRERQNPVAVGDSAAPTMGLGSEEDERRHRQRSMN